MKYLIKNNLATISGSSKVLDENENLVYVVKGSFFSNVFSKTYKKTLRDMDKNKLFFVKNKFWHKPGFLSAKIYDSKKNKIAIVRQSHYIKNGYEVEGATEPISIEGTGWNLDISLGNKKIGHISLPKIENTKDFFRISDAYVLEVEDAEDVAFLVAVVIAIDNIVDRKRKKK